MRREAIAVQCYKVGNKIMMQQFVLSATNAARNWYNLLRNGCDRILLKLNKFVCMGRPANDNTLASSCIQDDRLAGAYRQSTIKRDRGIIVFYYNESEHSCHGHR